MTKKLRKKSKVFLSPIYVGSRTPLYLRRIKDDKQIKIVNLNHKIHVS